MTRHINLMQPDILPGFGPWQVPAFLIALLLVIVGAAGYTGYHWNLRQTLLDETGYWQSQVQNSQQRLNDFRRENPSMASEADLLLENERLTTRLGERQAALSGLADQLDVSAQGFSKPLASLSDYDLEGIWLTRIELRDSQAHLGLEGFARDPGLVPRYLGQLEGSVFEGLSIQNLNIRQAQDDDALWRFSIADSVVGATLDPTQEAR